MHFLHAKMFFVLQLIQLELFMNNNKIAELRTALILILLLNSFFQVWVIGKETTITSAWLENSVQVDGKITPPDEWKEAIPVDVIIGEYSDGAPYTARLWIKNNELDLYILTRIEGIIEEIREKD